MNYKDVYEFWFVECTEADWWKKSADFDRIIKNRFGILHHMAQQGELSSWRTSPVGALCEIIILDQFSRNIFRNTPEAFASDPLALCLTQHAIEKGYHQQLNDTELMFLYMPLMHSESASIHTLAQQYFKPLPNYDFELAHKRIIDRFGRYPHRNEILKRASTEAELAFLNTPNSSF
ncbi:DUF924 domain-containing protein [Pseudoalteromonas sp. McH1-7]|uniref:DUF924 domain-containing protein n=1 Tax=Pseudoalteromonas peptidolytica F12-50-A1 TaxID=1315280 RepID=A0A8I0MWB4_9GAMM|nr:MULTISPECIES: DUF924 family protein [Pseudoalteromonas]MBE0346572.1 hypothetical protein [Pseudoalteromonas peptidolytica F12-50-A1]MDW7550700.1 DUF924 family protein [Pseudoalteromonas peptidolytica]NLR15383.1 DUF924 domain-containing protein [Pseudoalteromonas peptidolytica]NUZ12656.1 DUF924 domain-containing protein [Pseudoalteromonas sp. McH1-7]RXE98393.1 DUF924 domain-containing protein [Pseudoalteromonas sp. PS5]